MGTAGPASSCLLDHDGCSYTIRHTASVDCLHRSSTRFVEETQWHHGAPAVEASLCHITPACKESLLSSIVPYGTIIYIKRSLIAAARIHSGRLVFAKVCNILGWGFVGKAAPESKAQSLKPEGPAKPWFHINDR